MYQNPRLLFPEAVIRLRLAGEVVPDQLEVESGNVTARVERVLSRISEEREIRAVILDGQSHVIIDTGGDDIRFQRLVLRAQAREQTPEQVRIVRSNSRELWLYTVKVFSNGYSLILFIRAPMLRTAFREQFFSSFFYATLLALISSVLLALTMGKWIAAPLARMIFASRAVARGEYPTVPVEGPVEVQELAQAMNEMSSRVQTTQQSQRDFVANVSHELKTPLTSIQGYAQAVLDETVQTPDAIHQAASVIFSEAGRMHRLVLELLSLARLEAGTADIQHAPVDLNLLLQNVVEKFIPQANAAKIALGCEVKNLPTLVGDGDRLAQVFTNLVENAIKFSHQGGRVSITAERVEGKRRSESD